MKKSTLLSINDATIKYLDRVVFENLQFTWEKGQHWIILGQSGKEQSAFLDTLLGKTMYSKGSIQRPFAKEYQENSSLKGQVNSYRDLMALVSQKYVFRNKSNLQNFYYQQRFNSMESEDTARVGDYLNEVVAKVVGPWDLGKVITLMRLEGLKEKSLIKLSNGETRRLAIAAALIRNPKILLLDQPMTGLDSETRSSFEGILEAVIQSGIHLIMSGQDSEVPNCVTHIGVLGNKRLDKVFTNTQSFHLGFDQHRMNEFNWELLESLLQNRNSIKFRNLLLMNRVNIRYGEKLILDHVNWTVKQGERWALKGPNGAGKSTLLSLILGENPQAYANDIWLFDRKRGTGETIWEIKKNLGFVAPELTRFFPANQTCLKVVLSGLFDTMGLFKKASQEQEAKAMNWLKLFKLEEVAELRLHQIPLENQRFVLLARAMIKVPPLLVLDEAAQGMDAQQRMLFRKTIDQVCNFTDTALIYVSHYEEDIPESVNHVLRLENGCVVQNHEKVNQT